MSNPNEFTVPVCTRQSFGIELEFLVAYLPDNVPDPNEAEAHALPPLLRINETNYEATTRILGSIRSTLRAHGIPVAEPIYDLAAAEAALMDESPSRLHNKNKWSVALDGSVQEKFMDRYRWQPIEIQSPALWASEESFREIEYVTNLLTYSYRLRVNPTCGFHVHVGNGTDFFTGETIKRLGMFLWVADPMLSRLHAPWRRVHSYSSSIRYHSRLACEGITVKDVKKDFESWYANDDPIAVTKFSDTTREEVAFGSVAKWEAYAKWRNQVGPFMTIRTDIDKAPPEHPSTEQSSDLEPPYLPSWEQVEALGRHLREQNGKFNVPPEDHTLHRNIGWIRWDAFQGDAVVEHVYALCQEHFGTTDIAQLATNDQIQLVILAECAFLYGRDINEIDDSMFRVVLLASASYFEAARYGFRYNATTEKYDLASSKVGPILWKPRPKKEERIDSPSILKKWQNIAERMEPDDDQENNGDRLSLSEYNESIRTNEGISDLFDRFKASAGPISPLDENNLPSPPATANSIGLPASPNTSEPDSSPLDSNPEPLTTEQSTGGPFTAEQSDSSSINPLTRFPKEHDYSFPDPSSPYSPFPQYVDDFAPSEEDQAASAAPWIDKIRPHDADEITALYQSEIGKYVGIPDAMWDRIGWIPSILHATPDPAGPHAKDAPIFGRAYRNDTSPTLKVRPVTSSVEGLASLASCDSAMAVATLLQGPFGRRLNYNFRSYSAEQLKDDRQDGAFSANTRTVEFREAGGSLDAAWVATWAKIATGIVRFARRASPLDFLVVLDKLLEQEERDLAIREAKIKGTYDPADHDGEERYDICDLLDDMGLFPEALYVWQREQQQGPPR
ncbi:hypothetical protein K445DRAFT_26365 [Daldinia sp. EC12]|nr:hypothetical protein K445DRAFT_26365 [Daldinia sp. EC12]